MGLALGGSIIPKVLVSDSQAFKVALGFKAPLCTPGLSALGFKAPLCTPGLSAVALLLK